MDGEKQRIIASKGGKAAHAKGTAHEWSSDEARAAGRKGGESRGSRNRAYALPTAYTMAESGNPVLDQALASNFLTNAGSSLRNTGNYPLNSATPNLPVANLPTTNVYRTAGIDPNTLGHNAETKQASSQSV